MSLRTPDSIRTLQRKLYDKAKTEPDFRFYILYDKVWRADILSHAYDLARANQGAPGVDGVTFEQIETAGVQDWLTRLGEELRTQHAHGLAKPDPRDVSVPTGAAGDDPKARRRRAAARYPDHQGPGGADRGETGTGANPPGLASPARGHALKRTWTRLRSATGRNVVGVRRSSGCWRCFGKATPTWWMPI